MSPSARTNAQNSAAAEVTPPAVEPEAAQVKTAAPVEPPVFALGPGYTLDELRAAIVRAAVLAEEMQAQMLTLAKQQIFEQPATAELALAVYTLASCVEVLAKGNA